MIFKQYDDGTCDIVFSDEEIKTISNNKKIHLSDEALRHFGNNLVKVVSDWNVKFNDKIKDLQSIENEEIVTEKDK
tara:strand:+ start:3292 stop:3519 length:228 start_codon:yes stop_codon:yes gene_type:complete